MASFWSPNGLWDDFVLCWGEDWGSECRFIEILRILGSLWEVILAPKGDKKHPKIGKIFLGVLGSIFDTFWSPKMTNFGVKIGTFLEKAVKWANM